LSRARFVNRGLALIAYFVTDRRIYLATLVAVGALCVGFPFAVLDFGNFWSQQISRIQSDSTAPYPRGFSLIHFVPQVGWFFCALGALALLYQFLRGTAGARIMASFASLYLLAFSQVPARDYFFITILAPVGICIALLLTDLVHRFPQPQIRVILIVALVILILFTLPQPRGNPRAAQLAVRDWIIGNIPNGAKLCYAGWHTNGPRLVNSELESEAYNDYFMYGRDKNQKYQAGFAEAHRRYALSGRPLYSIANWGRRGAGTPEERAQLLDFCRIHGSNYLILGGIQPFGSLSDPLTSGGGISVFKL
jgi:hypothetical protein